MYHIVRHSPLRFFYIFFFIFVPCIIRTIHVLSKIGFDRLQPSPRYQTLTIMYI
jgi:hypothetical protein